MSREIGPELLAKCLAGIESGECTLEDYESAYPDQAEDLRSLVELAQRIGATAPLGPDPSSRRRGREQLLATITDKTFAVTNQGVSRFLKQCWGGWRQPRNIVFGGMSMPAIVFVIIIALTAMVGGGTVYAAQDALPGNLLYGVKTAAEDVQITVSVGDEAKAETYLMLAEKRLSEIQKASEKSNSEAVGNAAESLATQLDMLEQHMESASGSGKDMSNLAVKMATKLAWGQNTLQNAQECLPEQAKNALERASEKSNHSLKQAIIYINISEKHGQIPTPEVTGMVVPTAVATLTLTAPITGTVPVSATLVFTEAISGVEDLIKDPNISGQNYNGLLAKLRAAEAAAARGQVEVALNVLEAFRDQLEAMYRTEHISKDNYEALIKNYESLLAVLKDVGDGNHKNGKPSGNGWAANATLNPTLTPTPAGTADINDQDDTKDNGDRPDKSRNQNNKK